MLCQEGREVHSSHEEDNSRMLFHLDQISGPSNVASHTDETVCLAIALGCKHLLDQKVNIWLEAGFQNKSKLR